MGYKPSGLRVSHVSSSSEVKFMDQLATRGEDIEKKIRSHLEDQIPREKMQKVLFMVDTDHGTQLTVINAENAGFTRSELDLIQRSFKKSVWNANSY